MAAANVADADFIVLLWGDRWTLLDHHRGITHSILGTFAMGLLVAALAFGIERLIVTWRKKKPRIRFRGLLIASTIAAVTHPLMDWTNNYGVRPLLPWSGRWFYGDLVFIIDPYIWLMLGGTLFLLTSYSRWRIVLWAGVGAGVATVLYLSASRRGVDTEALSVARIVWAVVAISLIAVRAFGWHKLLDRRAALAVLIALPVYWCGLAVTHHFALQKSLIAANSFTSTRGESVVRLAAMPTVATPFRWQSVAETERAIYRFLIDIKEKRDSPQPYIPVDRFEKPTGKEAELVATATRERSTQALLRFARFPIGEVPNANCIGRTLVQFADLRYTAPGEERGNFSVNVPVDCPSQ
jgi:inner membrane protein